MYLILFFAFSSIAGLFLFNPFGTTTAEAAWFNDNWAYRQEVPITANAAADTNAFFSFTLDTATLITAGQLQSSCQDIRVTDQNGNLLQYHIGRTNACNASNTTIDALAPYAANSSTPTLAAGASTFYVYYGNPSVPSKDIGANFTQSEAASYTVGTLGTQAKAPAPVAYWKFDESSGVDLRNSGSDGNGIRLVQSKIVQTSGTPASLDLSFDQTPRVGNLIVVGISNWAANNTCDAGDVTDNQGNGNYSKATSLRDNPNIMSGCIYYMYNVASSGTFTITANIAIGNEDGSLVIAEYSGADRTSSVLDQVAITNGTSTTPSSGNITTTAPNELYFGVVTHAGADGTSITPGTNWTQVQESENNGTSQAIGTEQLLSPNATTTAATFTLGASAAWIAGIASFKAVNNIGNFGILSGATNQTENMCVAGKCLFFDGSNDYTFAPDDPALDFAAADNFTVGAWIKHSGAISSTQYIATKATSGTYAGYKLYMDGSGNLCFDTRDGTNAADSACSSGTRFDDDKWHFVQGVKEGTGAVRVYVDGLLKASDTSIASTGTLVNSNAFYGGIDRDGSSSPWKGFIDELKITRDQSARTAAQVAADFNARSNPEGVAQQQGNNTQNMPNALSNGLVGYWKMDEAGDATRVDASGNSNSLTESASDTVAQATGKFAYGGDFELGDTEYLSAADSASLSVTGSLTLAAWINPETVSAGSYNILAKWDGSNESYRLFQNADEIRMEIDSAGNYQETSASNLAAGTWYYVVGVYNSSNATVKIYINGVEAASTTTGTIPSSIGDDAGVFQIGAEDTSTSATGYYDGIVDEARVYSRALSNSEVSQLYNWAPGPVGYWKMDEAGWTNDCSVDTVLDSSGTGLNAESCPASTGPTGGVTGKFGKAGLFDDSDDRIDVPDDDNLDGGQKKTLMMWFKNSDIADAQVLMEKESISDLTASDGGAYLLASCSDAKVAVAAISTTDATNQFSSTTTLSANVWYHIALVIDLTLSGSDQVKLFINGQQETRTTSACTSNTNTTLTTLRSNNRDLIIGSRMDDGVASLPADGFIDDVKVYNYPRSQSQVIEDMNAGHPAPGSPVSTPYGYWKFDEGALNTCSDGADDACNSGNGGNALDGLAAGPPSYTSLGKFGKALSFNGSSASVNVSALSPSSGASQLAWSMWVKPTTLGTDGCLFCKINNLVSSQSGATWAITTGSSDNTKVKVIIPATSTSVGEYGETPTGALANGTWTHVAAVYDGTQSGNSGRLKIYINGAEQSLSFTGTIPATTVSGQANVARIASEPNNAFAFFNGVLDEVKIYLEPLTADQVKLDMNRGSAQVLGALSDNSTAAQPQAASQEYCVPGDTSTCTAPVAEWKMETGTGTTTYDTAGTANGTLTAGPTWSLGKFGKAITFDGSDDFIDTANITAVNGLAAMSISLWFKQTTLGTHNTFIAKADYQTQDSWAMQTSGAGSSEFGIFIFSHISSDSGNNNVFTSDAGVVANTWYHLQMTYDGSQSNTSRVRFYLNGRLLNTNTTGTIPTTLTSASSTVKIGKFGGTLNRFFGGTIDNVRIYNYARTHAQANWEYSKGGPLGHWKMDECQGTTINDSVKAPGTALTGTLENATPGTCTTSGSWFNGVTGKRNYSLDFDGTDDVVTVPNSAYINMDCSIGQFCQASSFAAWINADSDGESDNGNIFSKSGNSFDVLNQSGSNLDLRAYINLDTTDPTVTVSNALTTGTWNHVVMTYDNTSKVVLVYVNGILRGTSNTGSGGPFADAQSLSIGGGGENFDGKIDDFRVYNYVLLPGQVKQLYSEGAVNYRPVTGAP